MMKASSIAFSTYLKQIRHNFRLIHERIIKNTTITDYDKEDNNFSQYNTGFRKGIEIRKKVTQEYLQVLAQKCMNQQKSIYLCFIDKVFDRVAYISHKFSCQIGNESKNYSIVRKFVLAPKNKNEDKIYCQQKKNF